MTNSLIIIAGKAITYKLQRNASDPTIPILIVIENGFSDALADNIENLQFRYTLRDRTVTDSQVNFRCIQMVKVNITARKLHDPQLKSMFSRWEGI